MKHQNDNLLSGKCTSLINLISEEYTGYNHGLRSIALSYEKSLREENLKKAKKHAKRIEKQINFFSQHIKKIFRKDINEILSLIDAELIK